MKLRKVIFDVASTFDTLAKNIAKSCVDSVEHVRGNCHHYTLSHGLLSATINCSSPTTPRIKL